MDQKLVKCHIVWSIYCLRSPYWSIGFSEIKIDFLLRTYLPIQAGLWCDQSKVILRYVFIHELFFFQLLSYVEMSLVDDIHSKRRHIVNIMATVVLATQSDKATGAMVIDLGFLRQFCFSNRNIIIEIELHNRSPPMIITFRCMDSIFTVPRVDFIKN